VNWQPAHQKVDGLNGEQHEHGSEMCVSAFLGPENWTRCTVHRLLVVAWTPIVAGADTSNCTSRIGLGLSQTKSNDLLRARGSRH